MPDYIYITVHLKIFDIRKVNEAVVCTQSTEKTLGVREIMFGS